MKILLFLSSLLAVFSMLSGNAAAQCKNRTIAYYPVVAYSTPIVYQVYTVCPCTGTWGSPSCNCPDTYITTGCSTCGIPERQYQQIPGHRHGTQYEVYYADPDVYPTPYAYYEEWGYAVDP